MNVLSRLSPVGVHTDYGATFPPKTLAALWTVFWLLMISVSLQDTLHNPLIRWWEPVLWEGSSALVATGWMLLAVRVRGRYAPYLDEPLIWFGSYLRWLPLVVITWITAVYAIRHGVYAVAGRTYEHPGWGFVVVYESFKLTIFMGLWLGILFGIDSYGQWQLQRHRLLQTQKALAQAQLQGQLRPHFLFNARVFVGHAGRNSKRRYTSEGCLSLLGAKGPRRAHRKMISLCYRGQDERWPFLSWF